ncbi:MAG: Ni/Fe hydrogenase subunit alpha [Magnetospiraceae bacterium]
MNKLSDTSGAERRVIKVDALARVEGEGALSVRIADGEIKDVKFRIFEPPRFFEALLQGRHHTDAPDITARICGICPMAYIVGASQAMEDALGIEMPVDLEDLRRLIYCGEWIESHVLHAFLLHAPDFLGYQDSIQLSQDHPDVVRKALALKKTGNKILEVIGGRAIHPVNMGVGGFHKAPSVATVRSMIPDLEEGLATSQELTQVVAGFPMPDFDYDYTCVSLRHETLYPIDRGRIISNRGLEIPVAAFEDHFDEEHVAHSNALRGLMNGTDAPYLVGPIARYNNNFDYLSDLAKETAEKAGLGREVRNPFQSILVRMVETTYAFEEALRLAKAYTGVAQSAITAPNRAGRGMGCTEAPRGICYHRYDLDDEGLITEARIVPPTSQNQRQMERDLWGVVERNMTLDDEALKWVCEQSIRNYDPCISCATHFLNLTVIRD